MMIRKSLVSVFLCALCATAAVAKPITFSIHSEIPPLSIDHSKPASFLTHPQPGQTLPVFVDKDTDFDIGLSPAAPQGSSSAVRSIFIGMPASPPVNQKEKAFLSILEHKRGTTPAATQPTEVDFSFYLDPKYQNPDSWCIHLQAFQEGQSHPPFTMSAETSKDATGPVTFFFDARDDQSEHAPTAPEARKLASFNVDRGRWYSVRLSLQPSGDQNPRSGLIDIAIDGKTLQTYRGHWAYDVPAPNNKIGFDLGIYRRRQDRAQKIYFTDIEVK